MYPNNNYNNIILNNNYQRNILSTNKILFYLIFFQIILNKILFLINNLLFVSIILF